MSNSTVLVVPAGVEIRSISLPAKSPVATAISGLFDKRKNWQTTEYKKSTDILYGLLGDVYRLSHPIMTMNRGDRKEFMDLIHEEAKKRGIELGDTDNFIRCCCKTVFSHSTTNRVNTYCRVEMAAFNSEVTPENFETWLLENTGVEEVAANKKDKPKSQKDLVNEGADKLYSAYPVATLKNVKGTPKSPDFVVMLGEIKSNGQTEIYSFINKDSIVKMALMSAGRGELTLQKHECGGAYVLTRKEAIKDVVNQLKPATNKPVQVNSLSLSAKYPVIKREFFVFPSEEVEQEFDQWLSTSSDKALFLYGGHGTGKSTLGGLIPSLLYPNENDLLVERIEASKGINVLSKRFDEITSKPAFTTSFGARFIIIDEVQVYSSKDLMLIRTKIDNLPPKCHVILTSNVEDIDAGLSSRFQVINVDIPERGRWTQRMKWILEQEDKLIDNDEALTNLAEISQGDCR